MLADTASRTPAKVVRVVSPFNPANAVTASRFLTLPPFVWAVANGYHQWATLFIFICGIFDKLDGAVAKLFDCRSPFGEIFDAIADGICYGFALIVVAWYGWAPAIPVIAILAMGAANSGMRILYGKRAGRVINYKSYAMERLVGFTAFLLGFATGGVVPHLMFWMFVPFNVIVLAHDAKRMLLDPIPPPPVGALA